MKTARYFILTIAALFSLICVSCIDDSMTTSSSDILTFSRDTVNFDTVFTDVGTPTARLIVSNRAKKGINISSIRFRRDDTEFTLNVDGVSGKEFHDVEIRGNDSIYVFIECFIPETQGASPGLRADELEFVTNGVTQTVRVEAYGQNVTRLDRLIVSNDMTLTAEQPYVVFGDLNVEKGATLRIEPGAMVLFHDGASLTVDGRLEAIGEAGKLIHMRGDRLDNVLPDVGYDILAGQWNGVRIGAGSFGNRMEYVDMRSTKEGLVLDSCNNMDQRKLTLVNSWLHNSQGDVLSSKFARVEAYGCCFSEAAGSVVNLTGGNHRFIQCTFANNYLFSAIRGSLLQLGHCLPDHAAEHNLPLMKASFENCILYGLCPDLNVDDFAGSEVFFRYVSFKSTGENDDNFLDCLWDTDPMFLTDRPIYYFNYRLKNDSPVKSAGNPAYVVTETRRDMYGVDRLSDGNPSLGAFQFVPQPEETE